MATASSDLRNSQADDLVANVNTLDVLDSSNNVLVSFSVSFNAASSGQTTAASLPKTSTATAGGTAATARLTGGTAEEITDLSVGTSGTEVIIDNTSINNGQDVELQSLSYTAPSDPIA